MSLKQILNAGFIMLATIAAAKEQIPQKATNNAQAVFLENKGQVTDQYMQQRPDVQFALHLKGMNAFIGNGQIHYQFNKTAADKKKKSVAGTQKSDLVEMYRMDVELLGANTNAKAEALEQTPYYENYYLPQCDKDGANVHSYNKIVYHDVYPHIDWVLKIKDGTPEYEFIIKAGGKPSDIRIKYNGASSIKLNADGSFTATTPMGTVTEDAPYSFQQDGRKVNSSFKLVDNIVSFSVAAYTGTLTIDPALICATYYGWSGPEIFQGVSYDGQDLYLAGITASTLNIATAGAYQTSFGGAQDALIVKMDTAMTTRIWATYYGGSSSEDLESIAYDGIGNIYVGGNTYSTTGISTPSSFQPSCGGGTDAFLAKFTSSGARLWATYYGGSGTDGIYSIDIDGAGKINITGSTSSSGLATAGAYQTVYGGNFDGFIAQFDNTGARQWGTYYGGSSDETLYDICHSSLNDIYVCGRTRSSSGVATAGSHQPTYGGSIDGIVVKFNSTGTTRSWGTYYGGTGDDYGQSVAVDASGNLYLTGYTTSTAAIASTGSYHDVYQGGPFDAFLAKFNSGGIRQWATYLGGNAEDLAYAVTTDASGVYSLGTSASYSGLGTTGTYQELNGGYLSTYDVILEKLDFNGNIVWGTYYGGDRDDYSGVSNSICPGSPGSVYIAGNSNGTNALSTPGAYQTINNGEPNTNGFTAKFNQCPAIASPVINGTPLICHNSSATFTVNNIPAATTYYWTIPGGWSGASNTNTITVTADNTSGSIYVYATDGCSLSPIDTLLIDVPDPQVTIAAVGSIAFCQGDSVLLEDNNPFNWASYTYQWQLNNVNIAPALFYSYYAKVDGNYRLIMTDAGCNDTSNTITVNVTTLNPVVAISGNMISTTTTFSTYQWYFNGNPIPGANSQTYNIALSGNGNYYVVVNENGCEGQSNTVTGTPLDVTIVIKGSGILGMYPNPNNGCFILSGNTNCSSDKVDILITDLAGRVVLKDAFPISGGIVNTQVTLANNVPAGLYILKATMQSGNTIIPFFKQ